MATINTQSIAIEEKYSSLYKEVHCTFSVNQFPLANNLDFEMDYKTTTRDEMPPTMWTIALKFIRESVEGSIFCIYSVKRIDTIWQSIWISFNLEFFDVFWLSMGEPRGFIMLEAKHDREIKGLLYPVVDPGDINQLPNKTLNIKFCLNIFYIPATNIIENSETPWSEEIDFILKSKL